MKIKITIAIILNIIASAMASYFGGFWAVMALIIGEIGIIIYMTADL